MTTLSDDSNVIDLNLPGLGPDTIFAGAGSDFIRTSTLGGSLIYGQDDNDTIVSVGPNDTIYGGNGEDSIRSQRTPALLFGEAGNDTIVAEARATIVGGEGEDFLQGTVEANVIFGNQNADTLLGGAQRRDTLYGGKGNDAIGFFLSTGGNNLGIAGASASVGFAGNEGSNLLRGDQGDDLVVGINVRDTLFGGKGNDTVKGVASSNYLDGGEGNDKLSITNSTQANLFGGGVINIGIEKTTLIGGLGDDMLTGPIGDFGGGKNLLRGDEGNDTITVFATQDTVLGGTGEDFIVSSTVTVLSNVGAPSSFPGFAGRNLLDGGDGNDTIVGAFSTDTIIGGNDSLSGNDSISGIFTLASGGEGDDTMSSNGVFGGTSTTSITLDGGLGNDYLAGNTNVAAGFNNVTITNIMNGGGGNDTIMATLPAMTSSPTLTLLTLAHPMLQSRTKFPTYWVTT
jgi:Ca2+-binding RTX toxin-like protein